MYKKHLPMAGVFYYAMFPMLLERDNHLSISEFL